MCELTMAKVHYDGMRTNSSLLGTCVSLAIETIPLSG